MNGCFYSISLLTTYLFKLKIQYLRDCMFSYCGNRFHISRRKTITWKAAKYKLIIMYDVSWIMECNIYFVSYCIQNIVYVNHIYYLWFALKLYHMYIILYSFIFYHVYFFLTKNVCLHTILIDAISYIGYGEVKCTKT